MSDGELISIMAHGIADAQGDAYAEYSSEFDGYAKAALDALKKNLAGFSTNGVNVWGSPDDIKAVANWQHSHVTIVHLRRNLGHSREECGKVHAKLAEATGALKRVALMLEERSVDLSSVGFERISDAIYPVLIALEQRELTPKEDAMIEAAWQDYRSRDA